ncbi:MAG: hypothetical protein M1817_003198 [Caeruleum heppii]|nr:MAG: hypothetical protein M1817_003198 [Caeruleum heppii]
MGNTQGKPVVFTDEVNLNHFRLLRVVGKGAFGKVRIVERKDTGLTFALKYIRKDEGRYIVVDLMNGGDLRFHISRKAFTEDTVRFWIAELGCALRYIHKQGIVHRDLKPDNVLLDEEGHVHLADFNVASDFTPNKLLTSRSGTLAYLAPEVYAGKGYSSEVDWWSLGVTFFECIYNKRPFRAHSHEKLAKEIMEANTHYHVTQPPVSVTCRRAMAALLEKDNRKRIGAKEFRTFTNHAFFEKIDFEALEAKKIEPVFVPSSEKTNFDATYDLEELLLEEAPLEARARRQRPREQLKDSATDKEIREDELHRMIETLFEPFDYTAVSYDKYPGTVDENTASVGPPPEWVRPSSNPKTSAEESSTQGPPGVKSPNGSPPLAHAETTEPTTTNTSEAPTQTPTVSSTGTPPPSTNRGVQSPTRSNRHPSMGGGVQVVLDETGSWSELANQSSTVPSEGRPELKPKSHGSHGMLGFLTRKHGRGSSPKPQERGVLGREGARHIIS